MSKQNVEKLLKIANFLKGCMGVFIVQYFLCSFTKAKTPGYGGLSLQMVVSAFTEGQLIG